MKNEQIDESDSSCDCLFIEENEKKPKLEKLLIKRSPSGKYSVGKGNEKKFLSHNKLIRPSNQTTFYKVSVLKEMKQQKITKIWGKYAKDQFSSAFQEISVPNFKIDNINQDPAIDSTNSQETVLMENEFENDLNISEDENPLSTSSDFGLNRFSSISSIDGQFLNSEEESNEFKKEAISFGSEINSPVFDPNASRLISGKCCINDCFFGGKACNLSGLEGLSRHASLEKKIKYSDMQLEEPVLENLFSEISNSQTKFVSSEFEFDSGEKNDAKENSVDEDGSLLVVNRSDSNVVVIGYN